MREDIYCSLDPECKSPVGAVKEGEPVDISIHVDKASKVEDAKVVIFPIDDWDGREEIDLDLSRTDGKRNFYSCTFTPKTPKVYFYYFKMKINGEYKELRRGKMAEGVFADSKQECFQLTTYTKDIAVPDFMKGAIFYQIFPDRFYNSGAVKDNVPQDRKIHENWYENPDYLPDKDGSIKNNDFFGGDIKGIIEKLDYIKSLGVSIIYLNPIFESHSNHRYDTADYMKIDPLLGNEDDFKLLCEEARKRGIRIVLDGVFNHTGADSVYFNKNNRYDSNGAYNSYDSPYHDWYSFSEFPNKYDSWWGFETLPKLNKDSKASLEFIKQVVKKWIGDGASGFRFDVVDEISNERFADISKAVKEEVVDGEHATTLGEVWEDLSTKEAYGERKTYLTHNTLDSAMNYVFKDALFEFFRTKDAEVFLDKILRIIENYPKDNLDAMMNIISSHDVERAITVLSKEPVNGRDRYWQAEHDYMDEETYEKGKEDLKLMSVIQYFLPGNPCLYYGDEAGVYGYKDPFNRKTYPWGKEDEELIEFYQDLGKVRNEHPFLSDANFEPIIFNGGTCVFSRNSLDSKEQIIVGVNLSDNTYDLGRLKPKEVLYSTGEENFELSPHKALVLKK